MNKVYVNKIIPFSSVDGPGNRTVIFLQGCNFNCSYCHNPETINHCVHCGDCVAACPFGALQVNGDKVVWEKDKCEECDACIKTCRYNSTPKVNYLSPEDVFNEVNKYKFFISGITVSGGECTLQVDFLKELFELVKKLGLTTFIDTNGSTPLVDQELLDLTDAVMLDIKSIDEDEHIGLTGIDNKNVLNNLKKLGELNKLYEVRTVIVPQKLNNTFNVDKVSELIAAINPNIRYKLIKYRSHGVRKDLINSQSPSDDTMLHLKNIAEKNGCNNVIIL